MLRFRSARVFITVLLAAFTLLLTIGVTTQASGSFAVRKMNRLIQTAIPTNTPAQTRIPPSPTPFMTPTFTPTPSGQVLVVNTLADVDDGSCDTQNCSLREAVEYASWGATINFAPGLTGTIHLNIDTTNRPQILRTLDIDKPLIINGPGPKSDALTISGDKHDEVFSVERNINFSLNNVTIADGGGGEQAGGIFNRGILNVSNVTFQNNLGFAGGAVVNWGTATIINSAFQGNTAQRSGAIANDGNIQINSSTFQGNSQAEAAGIGNSGNALIMNSTIANTVFGDEQTVLKNTLIVGTTDIPTCGKPVVDGGGNLQFPGTACGTTIPVADPKLGPLQDNGGPTWTMALQPGSAAIGKLPAAQCPQNDQRGMLTNRQASCDIGAFQTKATAAAVKA